VNVVRDIVVRSLASAALIGVAGCGESFANLSASLGGGRAGGRGDVGVLFINNTPHRAVFTFGSYDQTDQFSKPDFKQLGLDDPGVTLDRNSSSTILSIECARVFSIGSPSLLRLIEENLPDVTLDDDAFLEGVEFFSVPPEDGDGEDTAEPVSEGVAPPFEALLGVDFPCNALLIIRFEFDDLGPDPFRTDFELIPSESSR
jgi:hypothetical protein